MDCSLPGSSVLESRSVVSDSLWPHGLYSPSNSPGQNTGVGSLFLLQKIFPTQKLNWGILHCRWILYQLSYQGSPFNWNIYIYTWILHFMIPKKTSQWHRFSAYHEQTEITSNIWITFSEVYFFLFISLLKQRRNPQLPTSYTYRHKT